MYQKDTIIFYDKKIHVFRHHYYKNSPSKFDGLPILSKEYYFLSSSKNSS